MINRLYDAIMKILSELSASEESKNVDCDCYLAKLCKELAATMQNKLRLNSYLFLFFLSLFFFS